MRDENRRRYLTQSQLLPLLMQVGSTYRLLPNDLHQLEIHTAEGKFIGYIDFNCDGEVCYQDESYRPSEDYYA